MEVFTRRDAQTLLLADLAGAVGQDHAHQHHTKDAEFHHTELRR